MASDFQVNTNDLDNIFRSKHPSTTKRLDVGYISTGTDISNFYEPSTNIKDQVTFNTGMSSSNVDLSKLFKSKNYIQLSVNIYAYAESYERYDRNNDGIIAVYVDTSNAKQDINGSYNFSATIAGTAFTASIGAYDALGFKLIASRGGLNSQNYTVTVTDVNANISLAQVVSVPYNSGANVYNPTNPA